MTRTTTAIALLLALASVAHAQGVAPPARAPRETSRPVQRPQITLPAGPEGGTITYDGPESVPLPPPVIDMGTKAERLAREAEFDATCKPVLQVIPGGVNRWRYQNEDCQRAFFGSR